MDEYFGLYVINADGTGLRPIMDDELRARDLLTRLPYVPEAWVKQAEEAGHFERLGNVLSLFGYETIRWLPDGSAWLEPGKDGLYLIQSDGSGATRLVEGKIYYFDPSPEGKYVSYAKRNTISIIDLNNLNSREIAKMPARSITDIQWSPDKDWILVSATQGPSILCPSDIYAIDIHSRQTQNLFTVSEGCLLVARWSPDIQHIELIQCKPGQKYLNVLFNIYPDDKQKTQLAQITGLYGCIGHRAWSPKRTKWAFAGASGPWSSVRLHIADSETEHHQEILSGYVPIGPMLWITDSQ
jgi:WD40 repeat protein